MYKAKSRKTAEWLYGSYLEYQGETYIIPDDGDLNNLDQYIVDYTTLCEKTELYNHGEEDIWEHDLVKISYPYCEPEGDEIYEVRKEYDCPGGCWAQSGFILDGVGVASFMSFEDTIDDYTNEICVEIIGNKFDAIKGSDNNNEHNS